MGRGNVAARGNVGGDIPARLRPRECRRFAGMSQVRQSRGLYGDRGNVAGFCFVLFLTTVYLHFRETKNTDGPPYFCNLIKVEHKFTYSEMFVIRKSRITFA